MIIPIRCFTCGEIMGDKWMPFIKLCNKSKNKDNSENENQLDIKTINLEDKLEKSVEGKVLDKLNINKICCRRMILTNVPLISYIN
tara:strand:- start:555 stop:812 length:258 start_codon:yes stop_codon:yes gene_type:complete